MKRNNIIFWSVLLFSVLTVFVQAAESSRLSHKLDSPIWTKFDEYRNISFDKEKARLNEFIAMLRANPTLTAYIVAYAGRNACVGEAQERANRTKNYLLLFGGIHSGRLKIVDAGYQEKWQIDLYVAPAKAPQLTREVFASTDSHLPRAQVKVMKCKGKSFSES